MSTCLINMFFTPQQHRARSAEKKAHEQHQVWHRERERLKQDKVRKEQQLRRYLAGKRQREAEDNEQRLNEARKRFLQSQELLRRLISEKEERTRAGMEEAHR